MGSYLMVVKNFRFDIDVEYQGWVLLFASMTAAWLLCLPCWCSGLSSPHARRFGAWVNRRLGRFYVVMACFVSVMMFLIVTWLPDWEFPEYCKVVIHFGLWLASHMAKFIVSFALIVGFFVAYILKDRFFLVLGLDHVHLFRCKLRDCMNCWSEARFRAIRITIWKVEDLPSASPFTPNNVFIEVQMGYNEPMRTRVHNNAGSECILKENIEMNFDDDDDDEHMLVYVNNQKVMGKSELARADVQAGGTGLSVKGIEAKLSVKGIGVSGRADVQAGGTGLSAELQWTKEYFEEVKLVPRGSIWLRIQPVHDENTGRSGKGSVLSTC